MRATTAVLLTVVCGPALVGCERRPQAASCLVRTASGEVRGVDRGASCAFLGIPFAAPPIGNLRWKPPQRAASWAPATLDATVPPAGCAAIDPPGTPEVRGSEDCLKLNVWRPNPAPAAPAPVIVWIDGGDFMTASANTAAHDLQRIAEQTGAIAVSANYRVGPFGFFAHSALTAETDRYRSSGNYGLLDQRAALGWIREHIASFGGDPASITIAGVLAGGDSVGLHLVSPGSDGYFTRAMMQSGFASSRWRTLAEAEAVGESFAAALGCIDRPRVLECLRSRPAEQVLLALPWGHPQFTNTIGTPWGPVVDALEIPDQPRTVYSDGAFHHVPVMIGVTGEEGWRVVDRAFPAFLSADVYAAEVETEFGSPDTPAILDRYPASRFPSAKHALARLAGDVEAICEARRVARLIERSGSPVYLYSLERSASSVASSPVPRAETRFVFGGEIGSSSRDEADHVMIEGIAGHWVRFAATGNPNAPGEPSTLHWPSWHEASCDFWEPFFLRSVAGSVPAAQP